MAGTEDGRSLARDGFVLGHDSLEGWEVSRAAKSDGPIETPYVVHPDSREQLAWTFEGITADADQGHRPIIVRQEVRGLGAGDYSLTDADGIDRSAEFAIERKSFEDAFATFGQGRARFERELERLNAMTFAAVVIEADFETLASYRPVHSQMSSKSVVRSILAWSMRFPRVHWFPMRSRRSAELIAFRLLERFHKDLQKAKQEALTS